LGIESTAHTFGCSLIEYSSQDGNTGRIISDIRDQYEAPDGSGIHPREASRHHTQSSSSVLKQSLEEARINVREVDVIAYSAGPGLGPCLRVGAVVARTLAAFYKKPLVPVNHALGHVELGAMLTGVFDPLVLLVSGGHTMILAFSHNRWRIFGETLDITIGQLVDQFGRAMGFASPCGRRIEQIACKSSQNYLRLPYVVKGNDVSFSGMLTTAIGLASEGKYAFADVCYSIPETAFAMIAESVERAISFTGKNEIMIVGGVAANKRLCDMLENASKRLDSNLFVCPVDFAGDNGAQIAWTGMLDYITTKEHVKIEDSFIYQSWRIDSVDVKWRK
jgi:N6-L-threonylcarbamoyladenine synthase